MKQTILEIKSQYEALDKTLKLFDARRAELAAGWAKEPPRTLVFMGCGSSYMVSCSLRDAASSMMDIPAFAMAAGDVWLNHS